MIKYFFVLLSMGGIFVTAAQLRFVEAIGGPYYDEALEIVRTSDNGYAIAGRTNSFGAGGYDLILSRFNRLGVHLWTRVIGGTGQESPAEEADPLSLVETYDGGLVMVGKTNSFGVGNYDIFLAKFSASGDFLWAKTIGWTNDDEPRHINKTNDGGIIITGETSSFSTPARWHPLIIKLDSLGNFAWATYMSWGTDHESGRGVIQTQDNGYILVGASWNFPSFGNESPTISKFDNLGNLLWSRQIANSITGYYTAATSIVEVNSGNIFVAGYTQKFSSGGGRDCFLSKFTSTGTHLWTKSWGGANRDEIYSFSLVITPDNNLVMSGYTQSYGTGGDIILSKFDTTGNHLWSRTVGGTNLDYAWSLALASDNGFAIAGLTKSFGVDSVDVILIKTDSLGMTCIGTTVNPVVGSPTPPIGTSTPTITHPTPTIQNQNPQVLAIVPDIQIICYSDSFLPVPFDLLLPPDSTILTIPRPTFIWEASFDSISGLEKYEVYINDTLKHTGMDTTWTADYDLSEGYNNWYVIAFDSAGNAQQSNQNWTVYIDYSGPYIDSTTVWHDTSFTGPFPVYTKVTDISGVDTVIMYFRRREDPAWFMIPMIAGTGNWYYGEIPSVFLPNDTVKYYIYAKDLLGNESTDPANAPGTYYWFIANLTGIQDIKVIPQSFSFDLENNPARDKVVFKLALPKDAVVSLRIYDVLGRLVDSPIAGLNRAGSYEIPWGAKNITGVYFYILEALEYKKTGKLIICR